MQFQNHVIRVIGLAGLLLIAACTSGGGTSFLSSGSRTMNGTTAHFYASREGHVFLILWHDVQPARDAGGFGGGGAKRDGDSIEIEGEYRTGDGKLLQWTARSPDGVGGTVTIDGTQYDLAAGGLLVVSQGPDGRTVTQVDRDLGDSSAINETLDMLRSHEPAVRSLFEGAGH